ncbi:MAG: DNA polymerase III subunit delta [Thermostichales cyanobacterium BF4_bins_65]
MPLYYFWGEDDYRMQRAVQALGQRVVHPQWAAFNQDHYRGSEGMTTVLNQALSPPFGQGARLVWWQDTPITQRCSPEQLAELERALAHLPPTTHLVLTSSHKPDGRLGSTKLIKQLATVQEFPPIPPWDPEALAEQVQDLAREQGLQLTPAAVEALVAAVGSDTRRLQMELEKLSLWLDQPTSAIDQEQIQALIPASQGSALAVAAALKDGDPQAALGIVARLLAAHEPSLKIVAVVVGQVRTWLWVKLLSEAKVKDPQTIAQQAEISNPKRVYFLQKEVAGIPSQLLLGILRQLLQLEWDLKRGRPEWEAWQVACLQMALGSGH